VVVALVRQLEKDAVTSGCSKPFVVISQATRLREIAQTDGYALTLEGSDLLWLEKAFRSNRREPREENDAYGQEADVEMKDFWSPTVTVRMAESAVEVERLLPLPVLERLCAEPSMSVDRQYDMYRSQIIVALDGESALGFAAYKPTPGPIRVAHEFWVDPHTGCGPAPVTQALLTALEGTARAAGCSRVFVVVTQSVPLYPILENWGYTVNLAGGERTWFARSLLRDSHPLESA
jgi:hypothetical protein